MATGSEFVLNVSAGSMVRTSLKFRDTPLLSVTVMVKWNGGIAAVVGTPESKPVLDSVSPSGSAEAVKT